MLKNITIKTRLLAVIGFLLLATLTMGVGGFISLNTVNNSMKSVYEDRLVALGQLDRVVRLANRHQLMVAKALTDDPAKINAQLEAIEKDIAQGDQVWAQYSATQMTPEEAILSKQFSEKRAVHCAQTIFRARPPPYTARSISYMRRPVFR